uniref:Fibronectin type-III domain-containing protein n=1 Tax=Heterorhabditis bacteriophora TaxID=37862 RepID=A0A1I7XNH6_HETBA
MDMKQFIIRTNKKEKITMNEVNDRISVLEERMNQLSIENANLTKINDELSQLLVTMTNKFQGEVSSLRSEFQSIQPTIPIPTNLRVGRVLNDGCYEIIWDLPRVKGYKVLTNGVERGIVKAPNNAARISDLEQEIEHVIQLQVIDLDGRLGEISKSLVIPKAE